MKHTCCTILLCFFLNAINAQVPDNSFGINGKVVIPYYANEYIDVSSVLLQTDGKILIGGYDYDAEFYSPSILVWRLNSDGSVDENFGTDGYLRILNGLNGTRIYGGFLALQPDNKIVGLGTSFDRDGELSEQIMLFRLKTDGSFDSTFGTNGKAYFNFGGFRQIANALLVKPNGKIIVTGNLQMDGSGQAEIVQFLPNGKLDPSFGVNGIASSGKNYQQEGLSLALTPDNKIIAGYQCKIDNVHKTGLARFNASGTVDKSFGINGTVLNKEVNDFSAGIKMSIAIQPNGKIIEYVSTYSGNFLYRYNANGSIDKVFGTNGVVNVPATFTPLSVITDVKQRRILINTPEFGILGYKADGTIDSSFGANGKLDADFSDIIPNPYDLKSEQLLLLPDSKILSVGYIIGPFSGTQFALAKFKNADPLNAATSDLIVKSNAPISLYPNPVTSVLNIKGLNASNKYGFNIVNAKGDIVAMKEIEQANFYNWNVQQLTNGMYYLNITSGNQKITIKFIKQ